MNVLLIANILLVVSYVGITIWRMKALPESISAMVYELPEKRQWVWSAWLCLVAVTLFEPMVFRVEFIGWLTTIGLFGAALTPLIDPEKRRWHYGLANLMSSRNKQILQTL